MATRRLKHNKEALQDSCHSQAQITEPETQPLEELTLTEKPGAKGTTQASHASEQDSTGRSVPESLVFYTAKSLSSGSRLFSVPDPQDTQLPIAQSPSTGGGQHGLRCGRDTPNRIKVTPKAGGSWVWAECDPTVPPQPKKTGGLF